MVQSTKEYAQVLSDYCMKQYTYKNMNLLNLGMAVKKSPWYFQTYFQHLRFMTLRVKIYLFKEIFPGFSEIHVQPAITCSKLTIEAIEQGVEYVQNQQ